MFKNPIITRSQSIIFSKFSMNCLKTYLFKAISSCLDTKIGTFSYKCTYKLQCRIDQDDVIRS